MPWLLFCHSRCRAAAMGPAGLSAPATPHKYLCPCSGGAGSICLVLFRGAQEHSKQLSVGVWDQYPQPAVHAASGGDSLCSPAWKEHPVMGLCGERDGHRVREHSAKDSFPSRTFLPPFPPCLLFSPQTPPHHNFFHVLEEQ